MADFNSFSHLLRIFWWLSYSFTAIKAVACPSISPKRLKTNYIDPGNTHVYTLFARDLNVTRYKYNTVSELSLTARSFDYVLTQPHTNAQHAGFPRCKNTMFLSNLHVNEWARLSCLNRKWTETPSLPFSFDSSRHYINLIKYVSVFHLLLLLSLDAHNHVDDYSGTLGGVCKVHISTLVTSP